jgi:hypothetical protein
MIAANKVKARVSLQSALVLTLRRPNPAAERTEAGPAGSQKVRDAFQNELWQSAFDKVLLRMMIGVAMAPRPNCKHPRFRRRPDARYELMRSSLRVPSTIRSGPSTAAPSKDGRKKKFRKLSGARSKGAPILLSKDWRRRTMHSSSKAKKISNADLRRWVRVGRHTRVGMQRRLAGGNAAPGRIDKLGSGPFYVRALRAHCRVAPTSRSRIHTAKNSGAVPAKSGAAPQNVIARGLELIDRVMLKAQQLRESLADSISQDNGSKPPAAIETAVEIISSSSQPIQQDSLHATDQVDAAPPPKKGLPHDDRVLIAGPKLELAIAEAVKKAAPGCEAFVGVIVELTTPKTRFDANWALRGARFGRSDRVTANEALATIVERMQREFKLSEE